MLKRRRKEKREHSLTPGTFPPLPPVVFTKDGMKVGVRHVEQEKYVDRTQNWVVKAWNMGGGSTVEPDATVKRKKPSSSGSDKKGGK